MALPITANVSTFRDLSKFCPSNNVRNLYHIMLNYMEAEEESDFSAKRHNDIQTLMDKYYDEMDSNIKIYEDELGILEEELEDLEFRLHMGMKLDTFGLRRVLFEMSRNEEDEMKRKRLYPFITLPWVSTLKIIDEEKKIPVVVERHSTGQDRWKIMPMTATFELAYNWTWRSPERKVEYPAIKPHMNVMIRSPHDLLHLAKASARRALHGVPKLGELRKARKWEALSERIRDLEFNLHQLAVYHGMVPYDLTKDLVRYRRIWYDTNDEKPWDLSTFAHLNSMSTREQRIGADIDRLVGECIWVTLDPSELAALIRNYGEYVVCGKVGFEPEDDIDEVPTQDKPRTRSMTDLMLDLCVGQHRHNSSLSPSPTGRRSSGQPSVSRPEPARRRSSGLFAISAAERSSGQPSVSRPEPARRRSSGQSAISATESTSRRSSGQSSITALDSPRRRSSGYSAISVIEEDKYTSSGDVKFLHPWKSIRGSWRSW